MYFDPHQTLWHCVFNLDDARQSYYTSGYNPGGYNSPTTSTTGNIATSYNVADYSATSYNSSGYSAPSYNSSGYSAPSYNSSGYSATSYNSSGYSAVGSDSYNLDSYSAPRNYE